VHAIAANDNAEGQIALEYLNMGLWNMLASGEWAKIAQAYLLKQML
jgi:hypothetical protein